MSPESTESISSPPQKKKVKYFQPLAKQQFENIIKYLIPAVAVMFTSLDKTNICFQLSNIEHVIGNIFWILQIVLVILNLTQVQMRKIPTTIFHAAKES